MKKAKVMDFGAVLYFALATAMYYLMTQSINLSFNVMYKHICAAAMTMIGFCYFLVRTDLAKAAKIMRFVAVLSLTYIIPLLFSVPVWIGELSSWLVIRQGIFSQLYHVNIILAMAGMVYMLGERAMRVNVMAMLAASAITFVETIMQYGFEAYINELWFLITTFADDTGEIIINMEIHELVFAEGIYLVYYIMNWRTIWKKPIDMVLAGFTLFFFLSGFKRIGVFAIIIATIIGFILWLGVGRKGGRKSWINLAGILAALMMLFYVFIVAQGFMTYLQERWGINLMGRGHFLEYIEGYYHFGPDFMGHGIGFLLEFVSEINQRALHNDILALYVDTGFWGLIAWGLATFLVRTRFVAKEQGRQGATLSFCYCVYLVATAMTDNTINYIYPSAAIAVLTMAYNIDKKPQEASEPPLQLRRRA